MFPVRRDGNNTIHRRTVPIFFVPGIMGSRLHFPSSNQDWEPDDERVYGGMARDWVYVDHEKARARMHFEQPVEIKTDSPSQPANAELTRLELERGWGGLSFSRYVPFLRHLSQQGFGPISCPIYAIGVDWRQDLRGLGGYVGDRVRQIMSSHPGQPAELIVVTHSQGGLIARWMFQDQGYKDVSDQTLAAVHVVQPADGAAVMYRRLFSGAVKGLDGGVGFTKILGNTPAKFRSMASVIPGAMQLLPNQHYYTDVSADGWLTFSTEAEPNVDKRWKGGVHELYARDVSPPGLLPQAAAGESWYADMQARVEEVRAFHESLKRLKHDETWAVYGTGGEVDSVVHFRLAAEPSEGSEGRVENPTRRDGRAWANVQREPDRSWSNLVVRRGNESDGTVPDASGSALFPGEGNGPNDWAKDGARQFEVSNVVHDRAFNSNEVRTLVTRLVRRALSGGGN